MQDDADLAESKSLDIFTTVLDIEEDDVQCGCAMLQE